MVRGTDISYTVEGPIFCCSGVKYLERASRDGLGPSDRCQRPADYRRLGDCSRHDGRGFDGCGGRFFRCRFRPRRRSSTLEVSYLGYETAAVAGRFADLTFAVTLRESTSEIESVVVTALGIKRQERPSRTMSSRSRPRDITLVKDANFINALTGKVAGVTINASSSGVGGASKVILRGNKSISQSSNALYVIDGIPMYNFGGGGGTEFDSRGASESIADLNPRTSSRFRC